MVTTCTAQKTPLGATADIPIKTLNRVEILVSLGVTIEMGKDKDKDHKDKDHKDKDKKDKDKDKDRNDKKDKDHKDKDKKDKDKDKKDKDHKDKDKKDKDHKDKDKKDKKDKEKKDEEKEKGKDEDKGKERHRDEYDVPSHGAPLDNPQSAHDQWSSPPFTPPSFEANREGAPGIPPIIPPLPNPEHGAPLQNVAPGFPSAPQSHTDQTTVAPPSGYRVPLTTTSPFPEPAVTGSPVSYDLNGSPLFVGSALCENSVHPCKIGPHLQPFASIAFGGVEEPHHGRFDLLPFVPQTMEWVHASYGQMPPGRRPIEGGYELNGAKLYHGLALVNGVKVPGKTGEHLGACNVPFGGVEVAMTEYEIL
ncbi:hypothetical protein C0992_010237 [Termitomyces sp. T32_za158]|nr:hypothetical protein C0992_010237 [Termitomyces sp. T32_za158]